MGLTDWIPGLNSTEGESDDESRVRNLYLADEKSWETELQEYRIMIGPDTESTDHEWAVYRCTEDGTQIPPGTELFVFEEGRVISDDGTRVRLHLAQLLLNGSVDESLDGYFMDFPEELAGDVYSEQTRIDDSELSQYVKSLPSDF